MMTPVQHHFPFFCDVPVLNRDLREYGFRAFLSSDAEKQVEDILVVAKGDQRLEIGFGVFMMVGDGRLFCWKKYQEGIEIRRYKLSQDVFPKESEDEFVEIEKFDSGVHPDVTRFAYNYFVTFFRKENLVTKEDYYEKYVIVMIHESTLRIIPMEEFNQTGGDPMYVWPALASYDTVTKKLHGAGMRMGTFTIQLA